MIIEGPVIKFGDKIDTDIIIPARYLKYTDPQYLAQHAMEPLDPEFYKKASKGVVIVAGKVFGMGSSREQAAIALKAAGVKAVIAESFARIFYRNAINNGLPVITLPNSTREINENEYVRINVETGEILVGNKVLKGKGITGMALEILQAGGIMEYLKKIQTVNRN
ncbi:3-isopropylmalate dehydratase small subunit [Saccharolobus solfataricus]|uniref:3-isopropylmalate dehydratase small subunit n=2 Tax=Saccharolobus solfataricus TaxID=2287 RepID=A0A0E3MCD3_SACSO|nr:3-isopropylmalate dehydratase small subunit [Saccharolobus solfataricus]AKA72700.1 3-isopropylmalate dehydratase small subunit [Saccharolobus solfataricus]AKA75400.1 3-isopropylmalate dehydratase small subunit [Saccharolobus solfataricus]AKA78091.1 3-isopropylmalate dehydratase small subunit [Saccharolobus solfataricus]AZF67214.1 3-isopropylmalate dehydratase small subunit [Saccharolobus solfataricus]AZF69834.1 3-isopropylmalate dehydratase small subunit [Saccharolobus solfataricus]